MPFDGGWTVLGRMLAGKPVIVHGDGTSLWTLTHHDDFARAFVPLLGHPGLLGDKAHSMVFDNAKVRSIVPGWRAVIPFEQGAIQIVEWYQADPARQVTDAALDAVMDKLAAAWTV